MLRNMTVALPTCMLLDTLVKSLFEPGRVPHLHIQISLLSSFFLHWSHRVDLHGLTLHQAGLRLLGVQAGLQGGPQDVHHLLDGAGGVGDSLGVVDPAAQQSSADVNVVILQRRSSPLIFVTIPPDIQRSKYYYLSCAFMA